MPSVLRRFTVSIDSLTAVTLVLFFGVLLLSLAHPPSLDDGLRHFAMANTLREQGMFNVPGWSNFFYEGWLHDNPVDPWFLSDVLLIPLTAFPLAKGLQLFVLFEMVCLLTAFLLALRSFRVPRLASAVFLLLLTFGETQFMGRFLFGRPYALLTAMTVFVLWAIKERRYMLVTLFLTISVLLSQLFVFPLFLCGCALLAFLCTRKCVDAFRLSIATVSGVLIGIALHPEPLLYVRYLLTVFLQIPFLKSIGLSREMHAGITNTSALSVLVVIAVIVLCVAQLRRKNGQIGNDPDLLTLGLAVSFCTLAFVLWLRAIDILWPLLLLFSAALYAADPPAIHDLFALLIPKKTKATVVLAVCFSFVCITQIISLPYIFLRDDASHSLKPYENLSVIPPHSRVLNLDWDRFFHYVAVRPDVRYAMGIDPSFTHLTDPHVLESIHRLKNWSRGKDADADPIALMKEIVKEYPSDYLVLSKMRFGAGIEELRHERGMSQILSENEEIVVFRLSDQ